LMVVSLADSTDLTVANDLNRRQYDVRLGFDDRQRADRLVRMAATVPGVEASEVWLTQPASILKAGQRLRDAGVGAVLTGLSLENAMYQPIIVTGRWLQPGDDRVIVLFKDTADENNIKVGDTVTLNLGELGDGSWQVI